MLKTEKKGLTEKRETVFRNREAPSTIIRKKVFALQQGLKESCSRIKEEFDDHLEAINQNTNEIQANYEYLCEIDNKIEKVSERVDEISLLLKQHLGMRSDESKTYSIMPLTRKEKEIFLAIYMLEGNKGFVSYEDISRRTAIPINLVMAYLTNLIQKGVPIMKKYVNNKVLVKIDPKFKDFQTKNNCLEIEGISGIFS